MVVVDGHSSEASQVIKLDDWPAPVAAANPDGQMGWKRQGKVELPANIKMPGVIQVRKIKAADAKHEADPKGDYLGEITLARLVRGVVWCGARAKRGPFGVVSDGRLLRCSVAGLGNGCVANARALLWWCGSHDGGVPCMWRSMSTGRVFSCWGEQPCVAGCNGSGQGSTDCSGDAHAATGGAGPSPPPHTTRPLFTHTQYRLIPALSAIRP